MAIAFNLPSEREATEENFSRLNRLLAELYDVLCRILVARQPDQEVHDNRRDRPYSESDIERPAPPNQSCRRSASSPPVAVTLNTEYDDDVFVSPRSDNGNDPFAVRNLEIFGCGSPRTPAGIRLSPGRDRAFTFSVSCEKHRDKGGTDVADGVANDAGEVVAVSTDDSSDPPIEEASSQGSIFSSIIPDKVSGSICTAIILMLGWKLFHKR